LAAFLSFDDAPPPPPPPVAIPGAGGFLYQLGIIKCGTSGVVLPLIVSAWLQLLKVCMSVWGLHLQVLHNLTLGAEIKDFPFFFFFFKSMRLFLCHLNKAFGWGMRTIW